MNFNTITTLIVSVIVVVLISAAAIVPIVQSAQLEQRTIEQNPDALYSVGGPVDTLLLDTVEVENVTETAINGVAISEIVEGTDIARVYVIWDYGVASTTASAGVWSTSWTMRLMESGSLSSVTATAVSFASGSVSFTDTSEVDHTSTYTYVVYPDDNGSYGAYAISDADLQNPIYVDSGKKTYIAQLQSDILLIANGTVDNITPTAVYKSSDRTSTTTITLNYEPTENNASNKVKSITDNLPYSGNQYVNIQIFIPLDYTVISDTQSLYTVLLGIIPLLIFVVPLMLVIRGISNGRD